MKRLCIPLLIALFWLPEALSAQDEPTAILEYFEDPTGNMNVTDEFGVPLDQFQRGEILLPGCSISTGGGIAEIKLHPNGSIIKLDENTVFIVCNLQDFNNSPINEFELRSGKIRVIAARSSTKSYYNVRTPSAVMSVLGTDFINEVSSQRSGIVVRLGTVEVIPFEGKTVVISDNQSVDTSADVFEAKTLSLDQVNGLFNAMSFNSLSPGQVPGHLVLPESNDGTIYDTVEIFEKREKLEEAQETARILTPQPNIRKTMPPEKTSESQNRLSAFFKDMLGMEVGVFHFNGNTYSKIIFQPSFQNENFRMALHLPIIFSDDLFDPDQWFQPQGNREWSFGTDQNGVLRDILLDILNDAMLKINYLNVGRKDFSPFYFNLGNIHNISLGNGGIMRGYANDHDYPASRKVGFNMGFDMGIPGLELVGSDLADPSLFGGRLYMNPFKGFESFEVGISSVIDLFPSRGSYITQNELGDPWLLLIGFDMEFFELANENASFLLFGDLSSFLPVFRSDTTLFSAGMPGTDFWYDGNELFNYAIVGGLKGHVRSFNWSLEYRMHKGIYKSGLIDSAYERNKIQYINEIINYIDDSSDYGTGMGIYGKAGIDIENKFAFEASYYWPWQILNGDFSLRNDDNIRLDLFLRQNLLPGVPLHGSFTYERTGFIESLKEETVTLFDGNSIIEGEIIYTVTPNLQLAFGVSTAVRTDSDGNILYEDDGKTPEVTSLYNLETRIHY